MYVVKGQERRVMSCLFFPFFACIMATLNRNFIGCNLSLVYGNMVASDRGPGSQEVGQVPWLVVKSQECEIGGNKFSLVYVKDSANIIWICV